VIGIFRKDVNHTSVVKDNIGRPHTFSAELSQTVKASLTLLESFTNESHRLESPIRRDSFAGEVEEEKLLVYNFR